MLTNEVYFPGIISRSRLNQQTVDYKTIHQLLWHINRQKGPENHSPITNVNPKYTATMKSSDGTACE